MQQRALARARRPDDRHEPPACQGQADVVECAHGLAPDPVLAGHITKFDGQLPGGRFGGTECCRSGPRRDRTTLRATAAIHMRYHEAGRESVRSWRPRMSRLVVPLSAGVTRADIGR
ncbi:hypothetical protein BZL30_7913 [Mycobacterium kansasii]|uniref:Uncharacterized protein n=1 Tax=Mycobacterium kansasii TaxID=1768 RepID=A0A1V3WL69_MYCKA|nr:hypothetical protein BZL30_7913 [Mycobacterium kansasii]